MNIVIVGCGRYGAPLASRLSARDHNVVVIDRRKEAFKALSSEFSGFTITGSAEELSVLLMGKIEEADCLFSVSNQDTLNLMVTQVAKYIFGVPKVIARVYKPSYEPSCRKFDIEMIRPTQLSLEAFLSILDEASEPARDIP